VKGYTKIKQLLDNLSNDDNQPQDARLQADSLSKTMSYLETGIMAEFWYVFLDRINATSCTLQDSKMDLNTVVQLYKSLIEFIDQQRNDFGTYELRGKLHSDNSSYREDSVRKRKRKKQFDEGDADETEFNPSDRFKTQVFLLTLDKLRSALVHRLAAYKELNQTFGFLRNLEHASTDMIRSASSRLQQKYPDDFEDSLAEELLHFAAFLRVESSQQSPKGVSSSNRQPELQLFLTIVENGLQSTFPNDSPDLSPADFFLFPRIKRQLAGKRFDTWNDLYGGVWDAMTSISKSDYSNAFKDWIGRCEKCISCGGDYFED
jgi:hypothetical protein